MSGYRDETEALARENDSLRRENEELRAQLEGKAPHDTQPVSEASSKSLSGTRFAAIVAVVALLTIGVTVFLITRSSAVSVSMLRTDFSAVRLELHGTGAIYLEGGSVSTHDLVGSLRAMRQADPSMQLTVLPSRSISQQRINEVVELARSVGITSISVRSPSD